ncbi:endoplasmic reticulum aminopeptidase 1-like [Penaeus monodon]|uniref:endoplasmic reticulum aminopeptidase 1-like n=1 Tax=Penaeus monodon TaxID=6687 RepID=UPI0018A6DF48|nr:endoplasmic reticulum aminopeptidase 1-like [Penaeus monodon]
MNLHGFYRRPTMMLTQPHVLATTGQPTAARKAFPCFDEPALKATLRNSSQGIWDDGPLQHAIAELVPVKGGRVWDSYEKERPLSTYHRRLHRVRLLSDQLDVNDRIAFRVMRVWARSRTIDQAEVCQMSGSQILSFFEDYFNGVLSPPEDGQIALQTSLHELWKLGSNNVQNSMPFKSALNLNRKFSLVRRTSFNSSRQVHYCRNCNPWLAHQWFGQSVTPKWWDDLWLNEDSRPIALSNVFSFYNNLGSSIPDDDPYLTEAPFRKGLNNYLKALWATPSIQVTRAPTDPQAILTQSVPRKGAQTLPTTRIYKWLGATDLHTTQFSEALQPDQAQSIAMKTPEDHRHVLIPFPPKDQWVHLQPTGDMAYYRVNYDDHNWIYYPCS